MAAHSSGLAQVGGEILIYQSAYMVLAFAQEVIHGAFLGTFRFVGLYKKVLYTTV